MKYKHEKYKIINACECCGKPTKVFKSSGRVAKYCSKVCARMRRAKQKRNRECDYCGEPFVQKQKSSRFCSKKCGWRYKRENPDEIKGRVGTKCKCCRKMFYPKQRQYATFCGRECAYRYMEENKGSIGACSDVNWCECGVYCGNRKACKACREKMKARRERAKSWIPSVQDIVCKQCGKSVLIIGMQKTLYCSRRCRKQWKRTHRYRSCHHRRARKYKTKLDKSVSLVALMFRDAFICQTCGESVTRPMACEKGKYDPRMATIGHIIAMASGGEHTWNNVMLECAACNSMHVAKEHGRPADFSPIPLGRGSKIPRE